MLSLFKNNGALSTVPFTATARLLQSVVLKKRNTKKKEQHREGGEPPRNAKKETPPPIPARHKKKERQAFHVPSSRSAPHHLGYPTRHHHPLFFSLVPVASPPLLLPRSQYPEWATLATIDISPLSSRVLSPSEPLLEPPRYTPRLLLTRNAAMSREKKPNSAKPKQNNAAQPHAPSFNTPFLRPPPPQVMNASSTSPVSAGQECEGARRRRQASRVARPQSSARQSPTSTRCSA